MGTKKAPPNLSIWRRRMDRSGRRGLQLVETTDYQLAAVVNLFVGDGQRGRDSECALAEEETVAQNTRLDEEVEQSEIFVAAAQLDSQQQSATSDFDYLRMIGECALKPCALLLDSRQKSLTLDEVEGCESCCTADRMATKGCYVSQYGVVCQ